MEFEISKGKLIKCIPSVEEQFIELNGIRVRVQTQELDIIIPEGVTKIDRNAFELVGSYVETIRFPKGFKSFANGVFSKCYNLKEVKIGYGIESIRTGIFSNHKGLKKIELPVSVTRIEHSAFRGCSSLEEVVAYNGLQFIGYKAFSECSNLKSFEIPNTVNCIDLYAFDCLVFYRDKDRGSIEFGCYPQNAEGKAASPIRWRILGPVKDHPDQIMLLSEYVLDCMEFDDSGSGRWEGSSLRKWLNSVFLDTAFNETEKEYLHSFGTANDLVGIPGTREYLAYCFLRAVGQTDYAKKRYRIKTGDDFSRFTYYYLNFPAIYQGSDKKTAFSICLAGCAGHLKPFEKRKELKEANFVRPVIVLSSETVSSLMNKTHQ